MVKDKTQERPLASTHDDSVDHLFCCDIDLSLCGLDISNQVFIEDPNNGNLCLVCDDLIEVECPNCCC